MEMEPILSVVLPVYNEEQSLRELHCDLAEQIGVAIRQGYISDYEIIFINDGSTDGSEDTITDIINNDPHVRLINLRNNFGKSEALQTGFRNVQGDIIITMDSDLQDDPAELIRFIQTLSNGFDLVSGWKYDRQDPLGKRLSSKLFNIIVSILSDIKLHDFNCGYKAYRREVTDRINLYGQLYRFIPILALREGFNITEIKVHHNRRKFGKSKFGFSRYPCGFFDSLTIYFLLRFHDKPMYFFGRVGLFSLLAGIVICAYLTVLWFMGQSIGGRPLLVLGVLCITLGVQFFSIGFIGDMIVAESHGRNNTQNHIKSIIVAESEIIENAKADEKL
jgi:glycosyltransferase involved in cell wall biosynthesis